MWIGEGTIEEVNEDGLVKIKVNRDHLYVACSACAAAEHVMITAYNTVGAEEGNYVRYEVDDSHLVLSSFVCFIMPLLLAAVGGFAGYMLTTTVLWGVIGAAIGVLIGVLGVKHYDKSLGRVLDTRAYITAILGKDEAAAHEG